MQEWSYIYQDREPKEKSGFEVKRKWLRFELEVALELQDRESSRRKVKVRNGVLEVINMKLIANAIGLCEISPKREIRVIKKNFGDMCRFQQMREEDSGKWEHSIMRLIYIFREGGFMEEMYSKRSHAS